MHVTTLNAGQTSHAPHQHPTKSSSSSAKEPSRHWSTATGSSLGPGSIIFQASNELHGIKNVGSGAATYHVVNWKSK